MSFHANTPKIFSSRTSDTESRGRAESPSTDADGSAQEDAEKSLPTGRGWRAGDFHAAESHRGVTRCHGGQKQSEEARDQQSERHRPRSRKLECHAPGDGASVFEELTWGERRCSHHVVRRCW